MIEIHNTQPRIIGLSNGELIQPRQKTKLSPEQFAQMKKERNFQNMLSRGWVKAVVRGPAPEDAPAKEEEKAAPEDKAQALRGKSIEDCKVYIGATSNRELLEAWHANDKRKGIKKAIELRFAELDGDEVEEDEDLPEGVDEVYGDLPDGEE